MDNIQLPLEIFRDLILLAQRSKDYRDGVHWAMHAVHIANKEHNRLLIEREHDDHPRGLPRL